MSLYMDVHHQVEGLTAEGVARAHRRNLDLLYNYGVKLQRSWFDEAARQVFCLVEAPSRQVAIEVHREVLGLSVGEIFEVEEGATWQGCAPW